MNKTNKYIRIGFIFFIILVKVYILDIYQIKGDSMEDNYSNNEYVIIEKISFIERGDVVIANSPIPKENHNYIIKRIIGIPGDKIRIEKGNVYIRKSDSTSFIKLNETYLNNDNHNNTTLPLEDSSIKEFVVPNDSYFVLGDNRVNSSDSRNCFKSCYISNKPFINKIDVKGKVLLKLNSSDYSKSHIYPELD